MKTKTIKLTDTECESVQNVFASLKGEKVDEGHIQLDALVFDNVLRKTDETARNE